MKRRTFLMGIAITSASMAMIGRARFTQPANAASIKSLSQVKQDWKLLLAPGADVTLSIDPIKKTTSEWKQILNDMQFRVLRNEGTERPFSSPFNDEKRRGVYACAGCKLPLFTSEMKYDSGTGWPSFITHIPGHLGTKKDYVLLFPRTEYHCVRCKGHQGHLFKDGPAPAGERWCNNGVALKFIPA